MLIRKQSNKEIRKQRSKKTPKQAINTIGKEKE